MCVCGAAAPCSAARDERVVARQHLTNVDGLEVYILEENNKLAAVNSVRRRSWRWWSQCVTLQHERKKGNLTNAAKTSFKVEFYS